MKKITEAINRLFKMEERSIKLLTDSLKPLSVPKRALLIEPGKRDHNIYFIEKGMARCYSLIDGKEVTSWFSKEGELVYSTNSFYGKTDGYETERVQLLEDSLLYYIPIVALEQLCMEQVEIANWLRILHQRAFVEIERRLIFRLYLSAEERYKDFLEKSPEMFQRVNLGYIASYLGMSHVTLCALRK